MKKSRGENLLPIYPVSNLTGEEFKPTNLLTNDNLLDYYKHHLLHHLLLLLSII